MWKNKKLGKVKLFFDGKELPGYEHVSNIKEQKMTNLYAIEKRIKLQEKYIKLQNELLIDINQNLGNSSFNVKAWRDKFYAIQQEINKANGDGK